MPAGREALRPDEDEEHSDGGQETPPVSDDESDGDDFGFEKITRA